MSSSSDAGKPEPRYTFVERSTSGHCCFEFTVIDMHSPSMIGDVQYVSELHGPQYIAICECFDKDRAEQVCDALNRFAVGDRSTVETQ